MAGRPKKEITEEVENKTTTATVNDDKEMIKKLMAQMKEQEKQMKALQTKVNNANKEKTDLEKLVDALKENGVNENKNLPKKVKIISLIPNVYNLTTQPNGKGRAYTFKNIGDMVTMKTADLEDILSIPSYREQAEKGYFYILDENIVADQDLTDEYNEICNEDMVNKVCVLDNDDCVDMFCNMGENMRNSIATKIAENINDGMRIDRNRLADIQLRTDIDIEKIAKVLKNNKQ